MLFPVVKGRFTPCRFDVSVFPCNLFVRCNPSTRARLFCSVKDLEHDHRQVHNFAESRHTVPNAPPWRSQTYSYIAARVAMRGSPRVSHNVEYTLNDPLLKLKEYFIRRQAAILCPKVGALSAICNSALSSDHHYAAESTFRRNSLAHIPTIKILSRFGENKKDTAQGAESAKHTPAH